MPYLLRSFYIADIFLDIIDWLKEICLIEIGKINQIGWTSILMTYWIRSEGKAFIILD